MWFCLECGTVCCSRNSDNQCSLKHREQSKHKLTISLNNFVVWCYECDDDLQSMIDEFDEQDGNDNDKDDDHNKNNPQR